MTMTNKIFELLRKIDYFYFNLIGKCFLKISTKSAHFSAFRKLEPQKGADLKKLKTHEMGKF